MKLRQLISSNYTAKKLGLIVESFEILRDEKCIETSEFWRPTNGEWNFIVPQVKAELHDMGVQHYPIGNGKDRSLFSADKTMCLLNSHSKQFQILIKFYPYFSEKRVRNEAMKEALNFERVASFTGLLLTYEGHEDWSARSWNNEENYSLLTFQNGKLIDSELLWSSDTEYEAPDPGYGYKGYSRTSYDGKFKTLDEMWEFLNKTPHEEYEDYTRMNGEYEAHRCTLGSKVLVADILLSQRLH